VSLSTIDLNLLLVLDTVLAERSVARAARRLSVTPSAISNALARLRTALGDPLFARSGRGIVPTPRAAQLASSLSRALRDLEHAVRTPSFDAATTTRSFTLAVADIGQVVRVPRLAALMRAEMPLAHLRVVGIDSLVSLGGLAGTEVDLVLGVGEKGPGVHVEPVFDEPTALVAHRGHTAVGKRLSRSSLAKLRHVAVEMVPGKGFRDLAGLAYARADIPREVAVTVPTFTAAAAVVAGTDLVTTLPISLLEVLGPRFALRRLVGAVPVHTVAMKLAWHERTHDDAAMAAFRALVRRALNSDASAPSSPNGANGTGRRTRR
jgi:DNA-binding transcriptional LysR family regulator